MCKLGDIIVVKEFKNEVGNIVKKHSFIVINDMKNKISGMNYDFVSNMICSFHSDEHKKRKLRHKENLAVTDNVIYSNNSNKKDGFIKADQMYYFDKSKIDYYIFGHIDYELLDELLRLILLLDRERKLKYITTNIE